MLRLYRSRSAGMSISTAEAARAAVWSALTADESIPEIVAGFGIIRWSFSLYFGTVHVRMLVDSHASGTRVRPATFRSTKLNGTFRTELTGNFSDGIDLRYQASASKTLDRCLTD